MVNKSLSKATLYSILFLIFLNILSWYAGTLKTISIIPKEIEIEDAEGFIKDWVQNIGAKEGVYLGRVPQADVTDEYYVYINKSNNTYLDSNQYQKPQINSGITIKYYNNAATDNTKDSIHRIKTNKKIKYILVKDENTEEKINVSDIPILKPVPFLERVKAVTIKVTSNILVLFLILLAWKFLDTKST